MPVAIFHGEDDNLIDMRNAVRLRSLFKATDTLITLKGVGHNGMTHDQNYLRHLRLILDNDFRNN
jgi:pimeloyl-ACP methyl ester carboxylesterase